MKAIILAGGKGSRLAPWHAPKCLLPVNGQSILYRILKSLTNNNFIQEKYKITEIVLCIGYRHNDIVNAVNTTNIHTPIRFSYCTEDSYMSTRLYEARKLVNFNEKILVCYGDELCDVDLKQLIDHHDNKNNLMTYTAYRQKIIGGIIYPPYEKIQDDATALLNIGFVVVEPECWQYLSADEGLSDWINTIIKLKRASYYEHIGRRATINSLADLKYAEEIWK